MPLTPPQRAQVREALHQWFHRLEGMVTRAAEEEDRLCQEVEAFLDEGRTFPAALAQTLSLLTTRLHDRLDKDDWLTRDGGSR